VYVTSTPVALAVESGDANTPCLLGYLQSLCVGGFNNGVDCISDADCPRACKGGANHGNPCVTGSQCPPALPPNPPSSGRCEGYCDDQRTLGPEPYYKLSSQWGTVKLHGANIVPNTSYRVRTQVDSPSGIARSATTTGTTRIWGDVDGDSDADGIDVTGSVNAFRHLSGAPPFEGANVWGQGLTPCVPDDSGDIDALDITVTVDAFRGFPFICHTSTTCHPHPPENPYRFTGRRLDFDVRDASGNPLMTLYDYRAREYDALHGRFLQRDPAATSTV